MLEIVDISDKVNKMKLPEIESMIKSAFEDSKRMNSTMKKILGLEDWVSQIKSGLVKANLQAKVSPKLEKVDEDPKEESKEELKEEKKAKKEEPKEEKKTKKEEPKEEKKSKKEEPKEDKKSKKEEPKEEKKAKKEEPKEEKKAKKEEPKEEKKSKKEEKPESPTSDDDKPDDKDSGPKGKSKIPKHIKTFVWNTYIGKEKTEAKCPCCQQETIDCRKFDCGHVVAEAEGGSCLVDNLRPICSPCNSAMGTMNMNDFAKKWFGRTL
jgi:flagellar biosynthesis GTPase FlhF